DDLNGDLLAKMAFTNMGSLIDSYYDSRQYKFISPALYPGIFGDKYIGLAPSLRHNKGPITDDTLLSSNRVLVKQFNEDGEDLYKLVQAFEETYYVVTGKPPASGDFR